MEKNLYELSPPSVARVVARGTEFGLLGANANDCDKGAWIVLRTSSSTDIERYYASRLESLDVWISVSVLDGSQLRVEMFEHVDPAGWDPRCH